MKKVIGAILFLVIAIVGLFYYEAHKEVISTKKETSQVVETKAKVEEEESNIIEVDDSENDAILGSTEAGKVLKNLKITAERQNLSIPCDSGLIVEIWDINNNKVLYSLKKDNEVISINEFDMDQQEAKVLETVESGKWLERCIYYQGQPLYVISDIETWLEELIYGDTKVFCPPNKVASFELIKGNQIYIRHDIAMNDFNDGILEYYTFNGTFNSYNQVYLSDWGYCQPDYANVFAYQYDDYSFNIYYEKDNTLVAHTVTNQEAYDGIYCKIGDYIIHGNHVLFKTDDTDINKEYSVSHITSGHEFDGKDILLNAIYIEDLENNMFFLIDENHKLYKGIIDEENEKILLVSLKGGIYLNTLLKNDENTYYAYYKNESGDVRSQNNLSYYKIDYEY